ncbi:MAG: hypothetical protein Q4P36_05675 [Bowdeniella nasicola]|nr:hypothetical protein [Bowdeniella nasicola]
MDDSQLNTPGRGRKTGERALPLTTPTDARAANAQRLVRLAVAAALILAVVLAYVSDARAGIALIALTCLAWALGRVLAPEGMVPTARSRTTDAIVLVTFALVLLAFLPAAGPGLDLPPPLP